MVRRGQLAARRDNRKGWLVAVPQPVESEGGPVGDRALTNLEDAIAELRDELAGQKPVGRVLSLRLGLKARQGPPEPRRRRLPSANS
jgi:hypothetical protein